MPVYPTKEKKQNELMKHPLAFWIKKLPGKGGVYNSVNINLYNYTNQNPINYIDPNGTDAYPGGPGRNEPKKKKRYKLTVYVDKPGNNYEIFTVDKEGRVDVGHTFVCLEDLETGEKIVAGFYPKGEIDPVSKPDSDYQIIDDSDHKWDVKKEFYLTKKQYEKAKQKIRSDKWKAENKMHKSSMYKGDKKQYNLNTRNCTDWVEEVVKAAGQSIPNTHGDWIVGNGSNPGQLAEELMKDAGESNKNNSPP